MPASSAEPGPRLQPLTRHRLAAMGETGAAWTAGLPGLLVALERAWSIRIGRSLPGGSASFVARAETAAGGRAVVKVAVDDPRWAEQVATLERADGRGYVRLLRTDPVRRALLLEDLGPSVSSRDRPVPDQLRLLVDTLALAWQDPGERAASPKAVELGGYLEGAWERLDRPCSRRVLDRALEYADRRAADPGAEPVFVHGDPHPGNLLAVRAPRPGAETGYVFVDPNGFVADRAYDLGVALRDWSSRLLGPRARAVAEGYCAVLAERSGVDARRIWEWGFLERVSTGLYVLDVVRGPASVARPFLDSAERLAD